MRLLSFDIESRMKSLGWYQIIGGILGICCLIYTLINTGTLTGSKFLLIVIAFLLFGFSIYCGNLLRKFDVHGLSLSMWNQVLQVLQFHVLAIGFYYCSGMGLLVGFDWGETFSPDGSFSLLPTLSLIYDTEDTSALSIWINFVPTAIIYWIVKIENDIEERKQLMESAKKVSEQYSSQTQIPSPHSKSPNT